MLKKCGIYLTQNRLAVSVIVLVLAFLPFIGFSQLFRLINPILISFITLRNSPREGLSLVVLALLPSITWSMTNSDALLLLTEIFRLAPIWLLSVVLARTASWTMVLQTASIIGMVPILGFYLLFPDTAQFWGLHIAKILENIETASSRVSPGDVQNALQWAAKIMLGLISLSFMSFNVLLLLLARGWQAVSFNPGGLAKELPFIHVRKFFSLLLLVAVLASALGSYLALNLLIVLLLPFAAAGLSIVHTRLAHKKEFKIPLLIGLYMVFILFIPYMFILLAFLGMVDSWSNFRSFNQSR